LGLCLMRDGPDRDRSRMASIGFNRSREQVKLDICWTIVPMVRGCGALCGCRERSAALEAIAPFGGCQ